MSDISHSWEEETPEAKARWFQSLPLTERMNALCSFTDMVLENNPKILDQKNNAEPTTANFQIVSRSSG
jgi:hypothetical protein